MDPLEFLTVARSLSESQNESERRTSIGRCYYAIFNHFRLKLEQITRLPGTDEDHQAVVQYLTKARDRNLYSVGQSLKDLRTSRNNADYVMTAAVDANHSRLALEKADKALEKFTGVSEARLKAEIGAQPTYRSRRTENQ
jgi:hypothetical protein